MSSDKEYLPPIVEADEVTDEMLALVAECRDSWWPDPDEPMGTEDFLDKFSDSYLYSTYGRELDNYDSPAARKIMREARRLKKEAQEWG